MASQCLLKGLTGEAVTSTKSHQSQTAQFVTPLRQLNMDKPLISLLQWSAKYSVPCYVRPASCPSSIKVLIIPLCFSDWPHKFCWLWLALTSILSILPLEPGTTYSCTLESRQFHLGFLSLFWTRSRNTLFELCPEDKMENRAGGNAWYFGDTHTSINEI